MARNKKQLPLLEKVTITDVAAEGKAIARVNDMVVFVPFVAPGDVIDIQLTRKKHSYAEGKAVFFHEYSPRRAEPFCEHFGVCGGCKWQHLPYEEQIRYKHKQVIDNLTGSVRSKWKKYSRSRVPNIRLSIVTNLNLHSLTRNG